MTEPIDLAPRDSSSEGSGDLVAGMWTVARSVTRAQWYRGSSDARLTDLTPLPTSLTLVPGRLFGFFGIVQRRMEM